MTLLALLPGVIDWPYPRAGVGSPRQPHLTLIPRFVVRILRCAPLKYTIRTGQASGKPTPVAKSITHPDALPLPDRPRSPPFPGGRTGSRGLDRGSYLKQPHSTHPQSIRPA